VIILGGLAALGPFSIDMYLPAFPQLAQDFHASASEVQLTLTAFLVSLGLGQLLAGAVSDALGRRRPLFVGLGAYVGASLLCAAAPSVYSLVAFRLAQGVAGAAGIVTSRAVVRDLYTGAAAARFFSLLMLVNGLGPVLAPLIGSQVLRATSWRGIFGFLSVLGVVLLLASRLWLPETLPAERRRSGGVAQTVQGLAELVHDRVFVGYALALGLSVGAVFSYVAGFTFVLQDIHGFSPQLFAVAVGVNGVGIVACSQANGFLVRSISPRRLLIAGLGSMTCGGVALLAVVAAGGGLAGVLVSLFVVVASVGFVLPNATALALADHPHVAGSASALLGVAQFLIGAIAAPLVGIAGSRSAWPMAVIIAVLVLSALTAVTTLTHAPSPVAESRARRIERGGRY
jgi:DHA1 family bicyclomycin/chloramphenicol resistance-like MFS transporter